MAEVELSGDGQRPGAVRTEPDDEALDAAPLAGSTPPPERPKNAARTGIRPEAQPEQDLADEADAGIGTAPPVPVPDWQPPAEYSRPTEGIPVRYVPAARQVPEPSPDERPLWTSDDDSAPDDGWLLTRPAPTEVNPGVPREPRRPALGLPTLVILAMLAAFFGWVSAEPLWLALGHAERGTATVTRCAGSGIMERCVGDFTAPGFTASGVALLNLAPDQREKDARVPALMASSHSTRAYAASTATLGLHLRWAIGLLLTLLCGVGIAWATGARRLRDPRARRWAVLLSLAGPVLLAAAFLATTW
jgi:hypothetical protein